MQLTIASDNEPAKLDATSFAISLSERISDTFSTQAVVKENSILSKRKRDAKACEEVRIKREKAITKQLEQCSLE
jgi:hypothetical protein